MSDCSMAAMLPKTDDAFKAYFEDGREITTFCGYPLREAFEKLQRYQQLEQVAMELCKAIAPMHEPCCEDTCCNLADMGWGEGCCFQDFREQLEALGVSVDD